MPTPSNTSGLRGNPARRTVADFLRAMGQPGEQAQIPDPASLPETERLGTLRKKFEQLHDGAHPLRIALDKLQTLDTVRIIEGKA